MKLRDFLLLEFDLFNADEIKSSMRKRALLGALLGGGLGLIGTYAGETVNLKNLYKQLARCGNNKICRERIKAIIDNLEKQMNERIGLNTMMLGTLGATAGALTVNESLHESYEGITRGVAKGVTFAPLAAYLIYKNRLNDLIERKVREECTPGDDDCIEKKKQEAKREVESYLSNLLKITPWSVVTGALTGAFLYNK